MKATSKDQRNAGSIPVARSFNVSFTSKETYVWNLARKNVAKYIVFATVDYVFDSENRVKSNARIEPLRRLVIRDVEA